MPQIFQSCNYVSGSFLSPAGVKNREKWNGVCAAMVAKWLKKIVIEKSAMPDSDPGSDFYSAHAHGIAQQGSLATDRSVHAQIDFFCKLYGYMAYNSGASSMDQVVDCLDGTFPNLFVHVNMLGGARSDHAIGLTKQDGKYYIFDPNYGLYEYESVGILKINLGNWYQRDGWECRLIAEDLMDD
jgi:hypothetical protein